ncbi:hypothetical protein B0T25DRAFT_158195 [Lasiosphaeria hispida]|uniref:Uncharacterized protein n=1 Tax=Lasiosphaeria hispida TaxID=260671 RepID=A0AAJ0MG68_9PEZI|nr:hypothetical protein B0T25DRAFT_158195 [Lasiosphaeria hispida]
MLPLAMRLATALHALGILGEEGGPRLERCLPPRAAHGHGSGRSGTCVRSPQRSTLNPQKREGRRTSTVRTFARFPVCQPGAQVLSNPLISKTRFPLPSSKLAFLLARPCLHLFAPCLPSSFPGRFPDLGEERRGRWGGTRVPRDLSLLDASHGASSPSSVVDKPSPALPSLALPLFGRPEPTPELCQGSPKADHPINSPVPPPPPWALPIWAHRPSSLSFCLELPSSSQVFHFELSAAVVGACPCLAVVASYPLRVSPSSPQSPPYPVLPSTHTPPSHPSPNTVSLRSQDPCRDIQTSCGLLNLHNSTCSPSVALHHMPVPLCV